ncbi:MAG: argininosuccinate lyase [Ardenticatenaceae bacterium]|nr:argininosuccinate lyase [Ardenticatenaceae bacterium]
MKLWGGRYDVETDELMHQLNRSIPFDRRLWQADITGSRAWAEGLRDAGLISHAEWEALDEGLQRVAEEWAEGGFEIRESDEDIHSAVERRLFELVGEVAGKLHTGRSRNDQVATGTRLFLLWESARLEAALVRLQTSLADLAEANPDAIMPGYTHFQPAQPILFAHWVLSHFWPLQRDRERLRDLRPRLATLPLGAGALAGHSLGVDRQQLARRLGFERVAPNSLDAVADRDFIAEFLSWAALLGVHLSRLAEDLIVFTNPALNFVRLDPRFTTGSSLMPQKANPDALELARGKSGRLIGNLVGLLTTLKGLPSGYNKDLQEDKEPLFDTLDTLLALLPVLADVVRTMRPSPEAMRAALDDAMLATDLADSLVRRGVPFREAHHLAGRAVAAAERAGCSLRDLPLAAYQAIDSRFQADLYEIFDWRAAVAAKTSVGGTAPEAVREQLAQARVALAEGARSGF